MKIEFSNHIFTKQTLQLSDSVAFLMGKNGVGKTAILETFYQGFRGKLKDFSVNDVAVGAADYQVLYLKDDFDLKEEIKFTRTSPFRNHLIHQVNQLLLEQKKYAGITEQVKDLSQAVAKIINHLFANQLHALTDPQIELQFNTQKITLENIIDQLLEVHLFDSKNEKPLESKGLNRFLLRMLVFNVLRSALNENDLQRPIIILFDHPELYTTPQTIQALNTILKELLQKPNFFCIIASNSPSYIANFCPALPSLHFVKNSQIFAIHKADSIMQKAIAAHAFLQTDEYDDWNWYWRDFQKVFNSEDLQKEWKFFFMNVYYAFLEQTYFDSIHLQDSGSQFKSSANIAETKSIIYTSNLKNLLFNYFLLTPLNISLSWDSITLKNYPKLTLFFKK